MPAQSGLGFSGIVAIQIPDDGAEGTQLTKQSDDNYDYDWEADSSAQRRFFEGMPSRFLVYSDFTQTPQGAAPREVGVFAAAAAGGSVFNTPGQDKSDHPGVWGLSTGSISAAGRVFIISAASNTLNLGGGVFRCGTWLKTGSALSTAVQRYVIRGGVFSIVLPNVILFGIGFEYQDDENGGRWQAICHDGVETSVDTGITVVINTYYRLEFEVNAAASSVEFFIDGVSVATITTNIPLGGAFNLFYNTHIMKLVNFVASFIFIDAYYMYKEITR